MSNEKFKVKFGLAVGDTAATVDGTTGNIVTAGDIAVNGGDITTTSTTANVVNANATTVNIAGAGTTVSIGADTGTTTVNNNLVADEVSVSGNLIATKGLYAQGAMDATYTDGIVVDYVTNLGRITVGSGDGLRIYTGGTGARTSLLYLDSSGNATVTGDVSVLGGDITTTTTNATVFNSGATTLNIGNAATTVSIGADTGTTTVNNSLVADDITTTGDAAINGGDITTSSTSATVFNATATTLNLGGAATTVTLGAATGTLTLNNATVVGNAGNTTQNLYNTVATTMNFAGAATTTNIGATTGSSIVNGVNRFTSPAIFNFAGSNNYRGLMVSNGNTSSNANARTGLVLRSFPTGAVAPRGGIVFENSRGNETTPAALQGPTTTQAGDFLGEIVAGGRSSTGWISDLVAAAPLGFTSYATENWVAATNVGTGWALQLQPTATTLTAGGTSRITTIDSSPQSLSLRSDTMGLSKGKTVQFLATGCSISGTTLTIGTVTSGSVVVGTMLTQSTGLFPAGTYIVANISGSGAGSTWTLNQAPGNNTGLTIQGQQGYASMTGAGNVDIMGNLTVRGTPGASTVPINYTRVYGQWQWDATVSPVVANTAYVFPIQGASGVTDFSSIASTASTSRIIPGATGMYKLQFSVQINNADNGTEHTAYIWWRKNGTDVTSSMGRVTVPKSGATIAGWDNMISSANATDYWELAYAVDDTALTFPYYASTAFGPSTACLFITLIPVGA